MVSMNSPGASKSGNELASFIRISTLFFLFVSFCFACTQARAGTADGFFNYTDSFGEIRELAAMQGQIRSIIELKEAPLGGAQSWFKSILGSNQNILRVFKSEKIIVALLDQDAITALEKSGRVDRITKDFVMSPALANTTELVGGGQLRRNGYDGRGRAIVIMDSGVDANHPFLRNKVIAEACFSTNNNAADSLCPNGQSTQVGPGAASPYVDGCEAYSAGNLCSHGTSMAGIAAGAHPAGDFFGVAPGASIIAVQVYSYNRRYNRIAAWRSDVLAAFEWVSNLNGSYNNTNIASVNLSMDTSGCYRSECSYYRTMYGYVNLLQDQGIVTTVPAGNENYTPYVTYPGCIGPAITVGASDDNDLATYFSNEGSPLDMFAPGLRITTSTTGGRYAQVTGTSAAAAHVAGAAAVLEQYGLDGGNEVGVALTASDTEICGRNNTNRCRPRLDLETAVADNLIQLSEKHVKNVSDTTAFIGFKTNVCVYGDYSYDGGQFIAPRNGICYVDHGITLGVDTPPLTQNTEYTVNLIVTDPETNFTKTETFTFRTQPDSNTPVISNAVASFVSHTAAVIEFESNICGYGDYFYDDVSFIAPRNGDCYTRHGITVGVDTDPLSPQTTYYVTVRLTHPENGNTDDQLVTFTTPPYEQGAILSPYTQNVGTTSAFVGFTSNICGYGDYAYGGGTFIAPRNGICYTDHGVTLGVDSQPLNPGTTYSVDLHLVNPQNGERVTETISFTTAGGRLQPQIQEPYVTDVTPYSAFIGYTSNICGYGDYFQQGDSFIADRQLGCYVNHGITIGLDTSPLTPGTTYTVNLRLTDPVDITRVAQRSVTFTTETISGNGVTIITTRDKLSAGDGYVLFANNTRQWISAQCRSDLVGRGAALEIREWPQIAAIAQSTSSLSCDDIDGNNDDDDGSDGGSDGLTIMVTSDKATSGDGFVLVNGNRKQWVNASCRAQLVNANATVSVRDWSEISGIQDVDTFQSCDDLAGGSDDDGSDDGGSNGITIMVTSDKSTSGDGFVLVNGNRKQWVSASCRAQLVSANATISVRGWSEISAFQDVDTFQSCDDLAGGSDDDGSDDGGSNGITIMVTSDKSTSGDGFVLVNGNRKQWVSASCRAQLVNANATISVRGWSEISTFQDVDTFQSCDDLADGSDDDDSNQVAIMVTSDKATSGGGFVVVDGTRKQWVDGACRTQLVNGGANVMVLDWNDISNFPDVSIYLSCDELG